MKIKIKFYEKWCWKFYYLKSVYGDVWVSLWFFHVHISAKKKVV